MIDGRHTGTGGGNHVVLGGAHAGRLAVPAPARPAREPGALLAAPPVAVLPVLRPVHRPDQPGAAARRGAPRSALRTRDRPLADAGAGRQRAAVAGRPALRNLLVDVTGNTHRTEICIDKLYSPDGATGRLGLVEFRAFEMPPDARMSLAQQLLLRALIAWFWREPQRGAPVRWGTACTTASCCRISSGRTSSACSPTSPAPATPSSPSGSRRSASSAFPLHGRVAHGGVDLELRQALEPWHVLGEEATAAGTARYVDSSVERLQVKVARPHPRPPRHRLQRPRAAAAADRRAGEAVAGVRFKAWSPVLGLHPTIAVARAR